MLSVFLIVISTVLIAIASRLYAAKFLSTSPPVTSVNYHISRVCNYSCGFCFHTSKNNDMLSLEEAKAGLELLARAGMQKLNFAGGEPLLQPKFVGELAKFAKETLSLQSVSIVTNGSKLRRSFLERYGCHIDIVAISCDSFDEHTNTLIGRSENSKPAEQVAILRQAATLCREFNILFKINTVVTHYNWQEDMNSIISELAPTRWKVFQVLALEGENAESVKRFLVSDEEFSAFLTRHQAQKSLVSESNELMATSYLLMDERMRFLDCSSGGKTPSESILDVGVARALLHSGYDHQKFLARGGDYEWSREASTTGCQSELAKELSW